MPEEKKAEEKKEASASKKKSGEMGRRSFINWIATAWTFFAAASATGAVAVGRFFFPNVLTEPPSTFKVGFPDDFVIGSVDTRFKELSATKRGFTRSSPFAPT